VGGHHDMPLPLSSLCGRRSTYHRRAHHNLAVVSHAQYVPMLTTAAAWRVKAAASKAAWWLWPFDLESGVRVTWATPVPILVFLGLSVLDLDLMYTIDRRQTKASLNAPTY